MVGPDLWLLATCLWRLTIYLETCIWWPDKWLAYKDQWRLMRSAELIDKSASCRCCNVVWGWRVRSVIENIVSYAVCPLDTKTWPHSCNISRFNIDTFKRRLDKLWMHQEKYVTGMGSRSFFNVYNNSVLSQLH